MQASGVQVSHYLKQLGFWGIHLGCLLALWTGVSTVAAVTFGVLYVVRMFGITGGYHRYFSHRTFKTSRVFQFLMALAGASTAQKGPLWWAGYHRHHHRYSDTEDDIHSPILGGFWWAHAGWVMSSKFLNSPLNLVKDLAKYPELRWLDRYHPAIPLTLLGLMLVWGWVLQVYFPELGTSPLQMLVWGFFINTTVVYHATFSINSLMHLFGRRRFNTSDHSKNSMILALLTMGEGWHNNHHRYPGAECQGFYWWEIDFTHYALKILSWCGIVWDLRRPPDAIYEEAERNKALLEEKQAA